MSQVSKAKLRRGKGPLTLDMPRVAGRHGSRSERAKPAARQGPPGGTPAAGQAAGDRGGVSRAGHYLLRLFVAGNGTNSEQALANLHRLCREHLNGRCTIETVDVVKNYEAAVSNNILVTPALILVAPRPQVRVLGNLSDSQKVLAALRLSGSES